jgi:hypothetical protein
MQTERQFVQSSPHHFMYADASRPKIIRDVIRELVNLRQQLDKLHGGLQSLIVHTNGATPHDESSDAVQAHVIHAQDAASPLDAYEHLERVFPWILGTIVRPAGDCFFFTYWQEACGLKMRAWLFSASYVACFNNVSWHDALGCWMANRIQSHAEQKQLLNADGSSRLRAILNAFSVRCRDLLSPSNLALASKAPAA